MENQNQQTSAEQPAQQSSIQQRIVPPTKSNQSKLFLIIFILLVTIPSGIYFLSAKNINQKKQSAITPTIPQNSPTLTPSTDPTADWKTYKNTKVGFEIKYPSTYDPIYPKPGGLGSSVQADGTEDNKTIEFQPGSIGFLLSIFPFSGTLEELTKTESYAGYSDYDFPTKKVKNFKVDGKNAIWYITTTSFPPDQRNKESSIKIFFIGNNHAFILRTQLTHDQKEIENILSTFKFADENKSIDTSSWKTYTNIKYGFSFKYPNILSEENLESTETRVGRKDLLKLNYNNNRYVYIKVFEGKLVDYRYYVNEAGVAFRFDVNKKDWVDTQNLNDPKNTLKELAPKKINSRIEAYSVETYRLKNSNCFGELIILPNSSFPYVLEINHTNCFRSSIDATPLPLPVNIGASQILSTFKFPN